MSSTAAIQEMLYATQQCVEHPVYHPEGTLNRHILLVALKAMLFTQEKDLVLAALLHDVHKPTAGHWVDTPSGAYWSNPQHAQMAASCDIVGHTIWQYGGNIGTVQQLILHHMSVKQGITKAAKAVPFMEVFAVLDDMIMRKLHPVVKRSFHLPDEKMRVNKPIQFVGQSPIQQRAGSDQFTVTVSGTPYAYRFEDVPRFFTGKWATFLPLIMPLIKT